jgi:hypothetical protein
MAGLPDARQALQDAFQHFTDPDIDPTELCCSVLRLSCENFAWHAARDFNADVALGELFDEGVEDALAELLWASRHTTTALNGPNSRVPHD